MAFRTRMIARLLLLVGSTLCIAGYSSCTFISKTGDSDDGDAGGIGGTFLTTLTLRDSAGVATTEFRFGEPIRFDLEVRNRTSQSVDLVFPDGQIYDFVVLPADSSQLVWRWSEGMLFPQVVTQLTFPPFSSKSYSVLWNGILRDGTQLMPGNYRARGALVFSEFASDPIASHEQGSPLVNFTVR